MITAGPPPRCERLTRVPTCRQNFVLRIQSLNKQTVAGGDGVVFPQVICQSSLRTPDPERVGTFNATACAECHLRKQLARDVNDDFALSVVWITNEKGDTPSRWRRGTVCFPGAHDNEAILSHEFDWLR